MSRMDTADRIAAEVARGLPDLSAEAIEPEAAPSRYEFVPLGDLRWRPAPEPLVGPFLPLGGLAALYGPPGGGKSFLSLAWSLCVGTSTPWLRHPVRGGSVIYVSAEGVSGLGPRAAAWCDDQHADAEQVDVHFVLDAVQLMDESEVRRFVTEIRAAFLKEAPRLVVFDTLARCLIGGDENSARDMGRAIRGADIIRQELGCTVLLIHHANKTGDSERGSTALRGAVDVLLSLKKDDDALTLKCDKSKDSEPFPDLELALADHLDSAIVTLNPTVRVPGFNLTAAAVSTLRSLSEASLADGLTVTKWEEVSRASASSFYRHRKALYDGRFVQRDREGKGARYTVTPKGEQVLAPTLSRSSHAPGSEGNPHFLSRPGSLEPAEGKGDARESDPTEILTEASP